MTDNVGISLPSCAEKDDLLDLDRRLRAEADELLDRRGLRAVLRDYGEFRIVGSYTLRLMAWRDLDVALKAPTLEVDAFFNLGSSIAAALNPSKMSFTNARDFPGAPPPRGLYWGIRLGDIRNGAWKIDLWAFDDETWSAKVAECEHLGKIITDEHRQAILQIKAKLWRDPRYRDEITSKDLYDAVLHHGCRSLQDFWKYMRIPQPY